MIIEDKKGNPKVIAPNELIYDGHPTINPDRTLSATDTYPIKEKRHVLVVDLKSHFFSVIF